MKISILFLLTIILLSTSAFRERVKDQNKPRTENERRLSSKSLDLEQQQIKLEQRLEKCRNQNNQSEYKEALKDLADFQRRYADHFRELKKLLDEVDSESKASVDKTQGDDDKNLELVEKKTAKQADDLDKEREDDKQKQAQSEEISRKKEAIKKVLKEAKQSMTVLTHLSDAEKAKSVISACTTAAANATPPEFCWKKGADAGVIPTGCPSGWERKLALCYKKCPRRYFHRAGLCHKKCPRGYSDTGLTCHRWWPPKTKSKRIFAPKSMTNFSGNVPCPSGMYKYGALCYRDCGKRGMHNCGIGSCARDSKACASNIVSMTVSLIQAVNQAISLIFSFGSTQSLTKGFKSLSSASKTMKKASTMMKGAKSWWKSISKEKIQSIIKEAAKDQLKGLMKDSLTDAMLKTYCSNVASQFKSSIERGYSRFDFSNMDVVGILNAVNSCKGDNDVQCSRAIIQMVSLIDPTGIATIASSFMFSECEGV